MSEKIELDMNDKLIIEEYNKQFDSAETSLVGVSNTKEALTDLVEEIASSLQYRKKDGVTLDTAQVKKVALIGAISIIENGPDKLGELHDLQTTFINLLKNDKSVQHKAKVYSGALAAQKEVKFEEKEVFEQSKTVVDVDTAKAIKEAVKVEIKAKVKQEKGKDNSNSGSSGSLVDKILKLIRFNRKK